MSKHPDTTEQGSPVPPGLSYRPPPPVAPARIAVLKANYKQAWLYFLLGLSLLFAWGIPIRYTLLRWLSFRPADSGPRDAQAFVALAFEGISESPGEITPARFREQVRVLKDAGYNAITLRDVADFYKEGKALPRKAVLLTFDHSRKSSYFDARGVLQRVGWNAVMFVWTKPILDEDPSALRWPYIRAMIRSGAWEAGAQSHRGFERIVADSEGSQRNFMAAPRWLTDDMSYETPADFRRRLEEDHEFAHSRITRETGSAPLAFAFPYGDFGQYDERALLSRRINMDLVSARYDLAFIHGTTALNTRWSNRHRLSRLLVNPDWSGQELVERLDSAWPRPQGIFAAEALTSSRSWLVDWGGFTLKDNTALLSATPDTTGAKVWLTGTDLYGDFHGKFSMRLQAGQAGFFLRATPDGESHLYLGLGETGEAWLRQKHPGMEPFTLATGRYTPDENGKIDLEIFLRGRQVYASIGAAPVFREIAITRGETRPGMVGLSVWDPEPAKASLLLEDLELRPFHTRIITWEPITTHQPTLAAWMSSHGFRHTHLAPPWLRLGTRGRSEQIGWDPALYRRLAEVYSMQFMPEVILEGLEPFDATMVDTLAEHARDIGAQGLLCNLSDLRGDPPLSRITAWLQNLSSSLSSRGLSLCVALPASMERETTLAALFQGLDNLHVAVQESSPLLTDGPGPRNDRIVSLRRVVLSHQNDIPARQLTGLDAPSSEWNTELRGKLLRQEGNEAFQAGEFSRAIDLWTRWSEFEPHNEEPLRLIGDVHLRQGDYGSAISTYKASLEQNPGQVSLVVRTASLLELHAGKRREATEMLQLYHRLFPTNTEILLAQAGMHMRQNQTELARERIHRVIEINPEDLEALSLLHGLLPTQAERVANIQTIRDIGARPGMAPHFASSLHAHNLLLWPESWRLMDFVRERAALEQPDPPGPYRRLLPRDSVVRERFQAGQLSSNWSNTGEQEENIDGMLLLTAGPATTEAALRLAGSDTLHSGFIESVIDEARGFFWLYARRSEGNMIRFGFDQSGKIYLQIWRAGKMVQNLDREWVQGSKNIRLRLEIRGDAAFAFIDGQPAFGAPTPIPRDMNLGWWGIAPWAPQFGVAQVIVREIAGGPLPVELGLFRPRGREWEDAEMAKLIRERTSTLNAMSPPWFFQDIGGRVRSENLLTMTETRLLARYYQIRLLPLIRSASPRTLNPAELPQLAQEAKVDGFVLLFPRLPDDAWFARAEEALLDSGLSFIALQLNENQEVVQLREFGPAITLFSGPRESHTLPVVDMALPPKAEIAEGESSTPPAPPEVPSIETKPDPSRVLLY